MESLPSFNTFEDLEQLENVQESEQIVCNDCDDCFDEDDLIYENGDYYCEDCHSHSFCECYECGDTFNKDDLEYSNLTDGYYCYSCYEDTHGECYSCSCEILYDDCSYRNDNPHCESCYDECYHEEYESRPLDLSKNSFKEIKSKRCFGVELEIPDDNIDTYNICEKVTNFGCYDDLGIGMEFYSPIMQGDIGYNQIKSFCDNIGNVDIDDCAGYHIHIDTRDFAKKEDWKAIQRILYLYASMDNLIYQIVDRSRRGNMYCLYTTLMDEDFKNLEELKDLSQLNKFISIKASGKFKGLHINSWKNRQTIELRYHHGTADFDTIINWVNLNLSLFEFAINGSIQSIKELLNFDEGESDLDKIKYIIKVVTEDEKLVKFYEEAYIAYQEKVYG